MWKAVLMLFALGAGPTDQPIKTTGFAKLYTDAAVCASEVTAKADALNVIYAQAEIAGGQNLGRWVGACVPVK